jgi:uncharacterized protein with PIN domain
MRKLVVLLLVLLLLAAPMAVMAREDSGTSDSGKDGGSDDSKGRESETLETVTVPETEVETHATVTVAGTPHETETEHGVEVETEHGVEIEQERTNATELRVRIRESVTESANQLEREGIRDPVVHDSQSTFLVGIDTFRGVRELNDTRGRDLSELEAEIEDSIKITTQAESRIRSRNPVVKVLMGGDDQAARQLEQEMNLTRERIAELRSFVDSCTTCSEQVKEVLQERIQEMEQEQERLREVASQELNNQGIIGWIWK